MSYQKLYNATNNLVNALPKCCEENCQNPATYTAFYVAPDPYCDDHAFDKSLITQYEYFYAEKLRKLIKILDNDKDEE